jgi:hypothetical protein
MRASRERVEAKQGRALAEEADEAFGGHGLGQHALHAGGLRKQLQNASGVMHRGLMAIDRAATNANNAQSRGGTLAQAQARPPHPDDLEWHLAKRSVPSPLTTILAVSAEEGSLVSRFGNGFVQLNALRDRVAGALSTTRRRLEEHDDRMRRRLHANAAHADALYEALERSHAASPPKRQTLELPESHALSWVHELVNWEDVFEEGSRLYGIVRARHKLREAGTPHAEIVRQHPTGYHYLDDAHHSSPSVVGDAVRRLLYRKETGADPPWHEPTVVHRVHRRMSERPDGGEGHGSHLRRLGVAFFEATVAAPFAFVDTLMPSGVTVKASEISFWEATLRYVVSSTVGCYFVAPVKTESATQGDEGTQDGDRMFVMRPSEEKLCFPAVRFRTRASAPQRPPCAPLTPFARVFVCAVSVCAAAGPHVPRHHGHTGRRPVRAQLPRLLPRPRVGDAGDGRQPRCARHRRAHGQPAHAQRGHPAWGGGGGFDYECGEQRLHRRAQQHERRSHLVQQ